MVKKYKHIRDSDDHSDIDSSGSAEMNIENMNPDNRGSNTDSSKNVDSGNNVCRSSRKRNLPIRFGKAYTHWKKSYEGGEDMWYMQWTLDGICIYGTCIWILYVKFVYTLDEVFFF